MMVSSVMWRYKKRNYNGVHLSHARSDDQWARTGSSVVECCMNDVAAASLIDLGNRAPFVGADLSDIYTIGMTKHETLTCKLNVVEETHR